MNDFGAVSGSTVLYTSNPPSWTQSEPVNVPLLIEKNGNHWRKICTILAKLVTDDDWRSYRDEKLLKTNETICFGSRLHLGAKIHLISGKESWARLEKAVEAQCSNQSVATIGQGKISYRIGSNGELYLFTPYFDSRQFPNALIAECKEVLRSLAGNR